MQGRAVARFPFLLLLVLAALTYWLDQRILPPGEIADGSQRHDPDYIVDNFVATRLSGLGQRDHVLAAARMLHFPDDDSTELTEPHYTHYDPDQPPVTITSDRGTISSDGENVYLQGNVVVTRAAEGKRPPLVMTTDYLHLIPDQRIARTDHPVVLREADSTVHAVGLQLDAEARLLTLSRVHATYLVRR